MWTCSGFLGGGWKRWISLAPFLPDCLPTGLPNVLCLPVPQVASFPVFLQIGHKGLFARNKSVIKRRGCAGRGTVDGLVSVPHQQLGGRRAAGRAAGWAGAGGKGSASPP